MPEFNFINEVNKAYEKMTPEEAVDLDIVLGAYRSFRGNRRKLIAYVSMPITTGRRLIEVMSSEGVTNQNQLMSRIGKDGLYERIIKPNISEGIALADKLGEEKELLFIAPSVFEAKKHRWSQDAYMSLWYRVIAEMAGQHYLMDGWEYSTGGIKEVLLTLTMQWRGFDENFVKLATLKWGVKNFLPNMTDEQKSKELLGMSRIGLVNQAGEKISIDAVLDLVVNAADDLHERGMENVELLGLASSVQSIPQFAPLHLPDEMAEHVNAWQGDRFQEASERLNDLLYGQYCK